MEILMGISDEDIEVIRDLRWISEEWYRFYLDKEDEEGLSQKEYEEFNRWIFRRELFCRMEALVDNQIILQKPTFSSRNAKETCENCSGASKEHWQRMKRMLEQDRKALEIAERRMDAGASS